MFTEAELRDALRHSADRADAVPDRPLPATADDPAATPVAATTAIPAEWPGVVPITTAPRGSSGRRPLTRRLAPFAAAAAVVVAAVAVAAVLRPDAPADTPADAPAGAQPTQPAPAQPTTAAPRIGSVETPAGWTDEPPRLVDLVAITSPGITQIEIGDASNGQHGVQKVYRPIPGTQRSMNLVVVPGDAPYFDAGRIPRDRPVPIAGTTGFYSRFKLFPIDGNTGPFSDKWLPAWTIAFPTPAGDWAFAYVEEPVSATENSIDDPAVVAAQYADLGVEFTPGTARSVVRPTIMPDGVRLRAGAANSPGNAQFLTYRDATRQVDLQLVAKDSGHIPGGAQCVAERGGAVVEADGGGACGLRLDRAVGDHYVVLHARGLTEDEAQGVLDSVEVADPADPSTWFLFSDLVG